MINSSSAVEVAKQFLADIAPAYKDTADSFSDA